MAIKHTENIVSNIDAEEVAKFEAMAPIWWDKNGVQKALHDINVLRVDYINRHAPIWRNPGCK
jgi:2-polyprenyl-6-hydroxyphenyl methylase/3-demethylubiquinone-9 3-methyltransferase